MKIIDLGLGVGTPDPQISSKWVDAIRIVGGDGPISVMAIHQQATDPIHKSAPGEPVSVWDHLFLILEGSVVASGGGPVRVLAKAGQAENGSYGTSIATPLNEGDVKS